ncbi:hypothetical protein EBQ90_02950 [bacterium]|nr:hypothetical protein [bacterium]
MSSAQIQLAFEKSLPESPKTKDKLPSVFPLEISGNTAMFRVPSSFKTSEASGFPAMVVNCSLETFKTI